MSCPEPVDSAGRMIPPAAKGERPHRPGGRNAAPVWASLLTLAALIAAPHARAATVPAVLAIPSGSPLVHAWVPKHADSLTVQSARARAGFRAAEGDSASGDNAIPYQQVARIVRQMFRDLGREHMEESAGFEGALKAQ